MVATMFDSSWAGKPKQIKMKEFLKAMAILAAFIMVSSMAVVAVLDKHYSHAIVLAFVSGVVWYMSDNMKSK